MHPLSPACRLDCARLTLPDPFLHSAHTHTYGLRCDLHGYTGRRHSTPRMQLRIEYEVSCARSLFPFMLSSNHLYSEKTRDETRKCWVNDSALHGMIVFKEAMGHQSVPHFHPTSPHSKQRHESSSPFPSYTVATRTPRRTSSNLNG